MVKCISLDVGTIFLQLLPFSLSWSQYSISFPLRIPITGNLWSVHFCSLALSLYRYLILLNTKANHVWYWLCWLSNDHNPPTALQLYFASPIVRKLWLFWLKFSYMRTAFFPGDKGTKVTWNRSNYLCGHAGHHALFPMIEVKSLSPWPVFYLTEFSSNKKKSSYTSLEEKDMSVQHFV